MHCPKAICSALIVCSLAWTCRAQDFSAVDRAIDEAIQQGKAPGAVLLVGRGDQIVYERAYGNQAVAPVTQAMTLDTVFDLASLTKPVATATSVMMLVDRGKIDLAAPVGRYLPEFANRGKQTITVEMLLRHWGGLVPDNPMADYAGTEAEAIQKIMQLKPRTEPGTTFAYTDVGFIVLGELVRRVDGRPLDQFAREEIFTPLSMTRTTFEPPADWRDAIAPTEQREGRWMVGEVHDPRAYALGGVAGHAGLFGPAHDLARWCRMLNNEGEIDGVRVLSKQAVARMLTPRALPDGTGARGLGVDMNSSFATCRGERFDPDTTFGHTGWTGTMLWSDPVNDVFVILLTNRVHPDGKGDVKALRSTVATLVGNALLGSKTAAE
jgi:serine-type D-Ala-D-Ala carboxypeptidase